jgi:hypothetical protein
VSEVALALEEGLWDTLKHPRGRGGEWTDVLGKLAPEIKQAAEETGAKLERPTIVSHARPLHQTQAFRQALLHAGVRPAR